MLLKAGLLVVLVTLNVCEIRSVLARPWHAPSAAPFVFDNLPTIVENGQEESDISDYALYGSESHAKARNPLLRVSVHPV